MPYPLPSIRGRTTSNVELPPLPFSDSFNRADGSLGDPWTGGTWSISSNKAINTPTLGNELLSNPGFETGDTSSWTPVNGTTYTDSTAHSGSYAAVIDGLDSGGTTPWIQQQITLPIGAWCKASAWGRKYSDTAGPRLALAGTDWHINTLITLSTSPAYQQKLAILRAIATNPSIYLNGYTGGQNLVDDASVKQLAISSLFATVDKNVANVSVSSKITATALRYEAGIVASLDSAASPANFVIAYLFNQSTFLLEKCVAGVYTTLINQAITYSAGAPIKISKNDTTYKAYYNNAQVGVDQTIDDATIISNTKHGLFCTDSSNSFDDFSLEAN